MFDMLSREELWELYWCLRDATNDTYRASYYPIGNRTYEGTYREMDSLRKEVYEAINPWPSHPVLI